MSHTKPSLLGRCAFAFILTFVTSLSLHAKDGVEYIEPNPATGSSRAVVVDRVPLTHTAQLLPFDKKGKLVGKGNAEKQTKQMLENIDAALGSGQSSLKKAVKLNIYICNASLRSDVEKVLAKEFSGETKPAVAFVAGTLAHPDALVSMDAVGVSSWEQNSMTTTRSGKLYPSKNPHSATLSSRGAVYVSGMAEKGEITEATRKTLEKIETAISHLRLKRGNIAQLKAFLDPMSDVEKVRKTIEEYFAPMPTPALVFVEWVSSSVPIEIEAIAALPEMTDKPESNIQYITPPGTSASPVYSRIAQVTGGKRIYFSGFYGLTTAPENDVKEIYAALDHLAQKTGTDFEHLAKATYYWSDPKSNGRLDAFRPTVYKPKSPPSASKARVKDVGLEGQGITIDIIGVSVK